MIADVAAKLELGIQEGMLHGRRIKWGVHEVDAEGESRIRDRVVIYCSGEICDWMETGIRAC